MPRLFFLTVLGLIALAVTSANAAEVTATATMKRGHIIGLTDISIATTSYEELQALKAVFIGKQTSRIVYAGQKLTSAIVEPPDLVKRNDTVTMVYEYGSLQITTYGRSLDEGAEGEIVQVMNMDSRQKVMAVIIGPDRVRVQ